jgi:hypothetical protein
VKVIPLSNGKFTLVDDEDYEYLSQFKWSYMCRGYAARSPEGATHPKILMHRVINNTPADMQTDHINRDRLDNRRSNLRTVTHTENMRNRSIHRNNKSGASGVTWNKQANKWRVRYSQTFIGQFSTLEEATKVRMDFA